MRYMEQSVWQAADNCISSPFDKSGRLRHNAFCWLLVRFMWILLWRGYIYIYMHTYTPDPLDGLSDMKIRRQDHTQAWMWLNAFSQKQCYFIPVKGRWEVKQFPPPTPYTDHNLYCGKEGVFKHAFKTLARTPRFCFTKQILCKFRKCLKILLIIIIIIIC